MARTPKPWYRKDRKAWFVTIGGIRHNLGPNREVAFQHFHELMAQPTQQRVDVKSIAAIIDSFLDWTKKNRAIRTYEWYLQRCQWFIELFPDLTTAQLKPFHLQQWLDTHPNWSNGHQRGCIIAIQRAIRWALKMGYIDSNPIAYFEKPQAGRRDQIITRDEFDQILSHVHDQPFYDLLITAWETGARPQELLKVETRHVDLKNSRWVFPKEEAKGKQRVRIVYLSETALENTKRVMLKYPEGPIFRNNAGRPWKPYATNCRFNRLKEKLGTKYCMYLFRHSYATRLLEAGVDALTVSILMGHSDTTMLGKVYQHLSHNPQHLLSQVKKAI